MSTTHTHNDLHTQPGYGDRAEPRRPLWGDRVRRISWGAILAGLFMAVSCQLLLSVLGLAVGFWSFRPTTEANPFGGLGTGAVIWWVVSGVLSLLLGGWVAGRMAGIPDRLDGLLHGLVTWGVMTALSFYLVGSAIGSILSATTSALGQAIALAVPDGRDGGGSAASRREGAGGDRSSAGLDINYEAIGQELSKILRQTDKKQLKPENLKQAAESLAATAKDAAVAAAKNPDAARRQLDRVMDAFYSQYRDVKSAADKTAVANVLAANTKMSQAEARRVVSRWQDEYQEAKRQLDDELKAAKQEVKEAVGEVKQEAREAWRDTKQAVARTSEDVAAAAARASLWTFFVLLAGAAAAVGGGALGAPKMTVSGEAATAPYGSR